MIIYKSTDRIPVKIGELTFWLSPMKWGHKQEIIALITQKGGQEHSDATKQAFLTMKYSVKSVDGLKNADGSEYTLETDHDGILTDEATNELFQLDQMPLLTSVAAQWIQRVREIELDGVTVDFGAVKSSKKKT